MAKLQAPSTGSRDETDIRVRLLGRLCSHIGAAPDQSTGEDQGLTTEELFANVLADMNCTREELLTLWVALDGALHAVRNAFNALPPPDID